MACARDRLLEEGSFGCGVVAAIRTMALGYSVISVEKEMGLFSDQIVRFEHITRRGVHQEECLSVRLG